MFLKCIYERHKKKIFLIYDAGEKKMIYTIHLIQHI